MRTHRSVVCLLPACLFPSSPNKRYICKRKVLPVSVASSTYTRVRADGMIFCRYACMHACTIGLVYCIDNQPCCSTNFPLRWYSMGFDARLNIYTKLVCVVWCLSRFTGSYFLHRQRGHRGLRLRRGRRRVDVLLPGAHGLLGARHRQRQQRHGEREKRTRRKAENNPCRT